MWKYVLWYGLQQLLPMNLPVTSILHRTQDDHYCVVPRWNDYQLPTQYAYENCIGAPLQKLGRNEGRNERKLRLDSIQERRRHVRIPQRTISWRGVWNHSARQRICHAYRYRTTRHPDRIHKHQFGQSQPRPLRGVQGTQRVGAPGACREMHIKESVTKTFLAGVFDWNWGFTHIHVQDIIAYLFTEYGQVEYEDLVGNRSNLADPWDANLPFQ